MKPNPRTHCLTASLAAMVLSAAGALAQSSPSAIDDPAPATYPSMDLDRLDEHGVPPGWMIIEGDILVPEDYFTTRATYLTNLWFGGSVPFEFDANVTTANRDMAIAAMNMWMNVANVNFVESSTANTRVHIQDSTFNNSAVGRVGGVQIINISSWGSMWTIVHELGHCLGLKHEQSRPDRDTYVQINSQFICQSCCDGPCNHNFDIASNAEKYGPYDFDSLMHYGACFFSTGANCPADGTATITVLPPNQSQQSVIGQRTHLSTMDARAMSFMYPQSNWSFVRKSGGTPQLGSFLNPFVGWSQAMSLTPTGDTLWMLEPDHYSAIGTYSRPMTWRVGYGSVTLGN